MKKPSTQTYRLRLPPGAKVERATKLLGVRLYEDEYERYQELAAAEDETVSQLMRRLLEAEYERVTRRRSG